MVSERSGPMFLLVPEGSDFRWYRRDKANAQPFADPQVLSGFDECVTDFTSDTRVQDLSHD